jgi:lipopolysaccharide heptosyltransferase I
LAHDDLTRAECSRILLIKPTALGDVVHTVPVLAKLRRRFPKAQIDWLITPENAELVRAHPALSRVVLFDRRGFQRERWQALRKMGAMLAGLRRERYELVIDLHGQLRSAFFTLATAAPVRIGFDRPIRRMADPVSGRPPLRHGWAGARELSWMAYNRRIPIPTLNVHAIERYLWLGEMLGFDDAPIEPALHLPAEAEARARELREQGPLQGRDFAVIAPGTMWETKHWRVDGFAEIARRLGERNVAVAIAGTAKDAALGAQIAAATPLALDLAGKTTPAELAALLRMARVCVTNDSGAMHLAVAMGTPVTAIFGPTDPVQVGPYGQAQNVVRAGVECSPCNLRRLAQCPYELKCMTEVSPKTVWQKVASIVALSD